MFAPRGWFTRPIYKRIYRSLAASPMFDPSWYRENNLGTLTRWQDPLWHFMQKGWKQGLNPSSRFDTDFYLSHNKDVAASGINPLFHYVEYGQPERRAPLRPGEILTSQVMSEPAPLRIFRAEAPHPRVTIMIDNHTPDHPILGDGPTLRSAHQMALSLGRKLRVIMLRTQGPTRFSAHTEYESLVIHKSADYGDVPYSSGELWLCTSWSTVKSLQAPSSTVNVAYMALDCEICRAQPGIQQIFAQQTLAENSGRLFVANSELRGHLADEHGLDVPATRVFESFRHLVNPEKKGPVKKGTKKMTLSFVAMPSKPTTLFAKGVELLEAALSEGVLSENEWDIRFFGEDVPSVSLLRSIEVVPTPLQSEGDYWRMLGETDVLVTWDSPGVSALVARDAIHMGITTVTNHDIRSELVDQANLCVAQGMGREGMVEALRASIREPRTHRKIVPNPQELEEQRKVFISNLRDLVGHA